MADNINERGKSPIKNISFLLFATAVLLWSATGAAAQSASPSPTPSPEPRSETITWFGGYNVTTSIEAGVRGARVGGNENKYRSDFNYRPGFRLFDSSFLIENKDHKSRAIDSLLVTSTGWDSDPYGSTRISVERAGFYKFDGNVRQVVYFNNLNNHARNSRRTNTRHNFGDFDLYLYPNSDKFRVRLGGGFNKTKGSGTLTTRPFSDEYIVDSDVDNGTTDLRAGVDTKLLGFNMSATYGWRRFRDSTFYSTSSNIGFNTGSTSGEIVNFSRQYPIKGATNYGLFNIQRTFAKKLDFTGRVVYSLTERRFEVLEQITGLQNCTPVPPATTCNRNIVDLDRFNISGDSNRSQTRVDLGVTYAVTNDFRISNTFTYDTFDISGGTAFAEALFTRTSTGGTRNPVFTNTNFHRVTGYERFMNTLEADYQFRDWLGINIGYRYTKRNIELSGFNQTLPPATTPTRTLLNEVEHNQTNTLIAGFKAKPLKNWSLFGDLEWGEADNAFTRLANNKVRNFRLRSRWGFNQFVFNVSAISKDNENPSFSTAPQGGVTGEFIANTKSRLFSAFVDWTPLANYSFSGGYTYQHLTSETDIVVPLTVGTSTVFRRGFSQFFMRDHNMFFNVTARPIKRVSVFAGYNFNKDRGQGDLVSTAPQFILTSYPFRLYTMDSRIAIRLTKNIDWNVGYQYIGYNERIQPLSVGRPQDYHANLPYTSLRIYFGGGER
jgi:hypothetical protein